MLPSPSMRNAVVTPVDRPYHAVIRHNNDLNAVTYQTKSAPILTNRTPKQLAHNQNKRERSFE